MKKEKYIKIINDTPLSLDFQDVRSYLSGIYAVAVEDVDITSDDMLELTITGDKVKLSVLGEESRTDEP